jgi:hypothetical protein
MESFMPDYIVCYKKRNNPRMHVHVCEKKCTLKEECKELALHRDNQSRDSGSEHPESVERQAA